MKIKVIKTDKLHPQKKYNLFDFLDNSIQTLRENTVLAVASKVVSICQGLVVKITSEDDQKKYEQKLKLIKDQADLFHIPSQNSKSVVTLKNNILQIASGIDESNADGHFILLPKTIYKTTNDIRAHLRKKHCIDKLGVIITDSRSTPLRRGVVGVALSYSGFEPIISYIGENDLFDRGMKVSETNLLDCLASAAVAEMGEGFEQTPIAVIEDIKRIKFQDQDPSLIELNTLCHQIEYDLYYDLIKNVKWDSVKKNKIQ